MATANLLQTSVSGGTQNALSLQGDGVFFPKASTASRLALTLTTTDKGFIVYDTTDNNIYFWNGAAWESIPGSGDAGANGSVQYNDNGIVSGASNFTYDKATSAVAITGDLTVDTSTLKVDSANNRVGIGTATPALPLDVVGGMQVTSGSAGGLYQWAYGASASSRSWRAWNDVSANGDFQISTSTTRTGSTYSDRYRIDVTGVHEWFNTSGTAMTLNSTGLGVGITDTTNGRLSVRAGTAATGNSAFFQNLDGTYNSYLQIQHSSNGVKLYTNSSYGGDAGNLTIGCSSAVNALIVNGSGNVGIGVTPTTIVGASGVNGKGLQGDSWTISSQGGTNDSYFGNNLYTSAYTVWSNRVNAASGAYYISGGTHIFYRGAAQAAGTITPTESARIDASGNLILQPSSTPPSLFANGQLTVNATSNTNLRFSYRGSDGTTRVANITLA